MAAAEEAAGDSVEMVGPVLKEEVHLAAAAEEAVMEAMGEMEIDTLMEEEAAAAAVTGVQEITP